MIEEELMARRMKSFLERAVRNIVAYGDTDIFPYPTENTIFNHDKDDIVDMLLELDKSFDDYLTRYPPEHESQLSPVGYTGFRWATQLDPFWNAYFLGLVISLGENIEAARLPIENDEIFSYRFNKNKKDDNLFLNSGSWRTFMEKSYMLSKEYNFVLICDIADFYQRAGHHSLESALKQCSKDSNAIPKIMSFLSNFSNTKSYSLPVGGPAARILSELVLNKTDRLLHTRGIRFCRFADDYHIFANEKNDLYKILVFLSEKMITNEGLSIQKAKTRIMSGVEYQSTSPIRPEGEEGEQVGSPTLNHLMRLTLRFDPYSPTAEDDYEELKEKVQQYDIIGLLQSELGKTRIHANVVRKLVQTLKYLDERQKNDAVYTMIDNYELLFPLFSTVLIAIYDLYDTLNQPTKAHIQETLRGLISEKHYVMSLELHVAYAVRIIAKENTPENEDIITQIYDSSTSSIVKRDVILTMAKWEHYYWLSDLKNRFRTLSPNERRAFIIASYRLTDEGKHWREHTKKEFSPFEERCRQWASQRVDQHKWDVPL